MADLPEARTVIDELLFSRVGVDCFGPLMVKYRRAEVKRYGCIFTCLSSRAVHIEISHQLDVDSFINAFRRFISRQSNPREVYSDNGRNFVGAETILKKELKEWNLQVFDEYFKHKDWYFNPPAANHIGGVWEG